MKVALILLILFLTFMGIEQAAGQNDSVKTDSITLEWYNQKVNTEPLMLVDFSASWCMPCKQMLPVISEIEQTYQGKVYVLRVDYDHYAQLCRSLGVNEIPFIKIYKKGKLVNNYIGVISKKEIISNF